MNEYRRLAVIIPALNEASTVADVVRGARGLGCAVFVVDDCSDDGTGSGAREAGATVLRLPFPCGAWNAIQAGLAHALDSGRFDGYLTMDADGQHHPASIPLLLQARAETGAEVVIGSCLERGDALRRAVWRFFSLLTRLPVRDVTSGLRLYTQSAARAALTGEAVMCDYQDLGVLLLLRRRGFSLAETVVTMGRRRCGGSRVFHSPAAVFAYLIKTGVNIVAHWLASGASGEEEQDAA